MANSLLETAISNLLVASVLALATILVTRLWKSSQVAHLLWLLVLAKLITPPLWQVKLPAPVRNSSELASATVSIETSDWSDLGTARAVVSVPDERSSIESDSEIFSPIVRQMKPHDRTASSRGGLGTFIATIQTWLQRANRAISAHAWMISLTWLAASASCALLIVVRVVRFNRMLRHTLPADEDLNRLTQNIAKRLDLEHVPTIQLTDAAIAPMVWPAALRGRIVLPRRLVDELCEEQLSLILSHELSHLQRLDHWVRFLEVVVVTIYWWNPIVWWVRRKLHAAEEACCDSRVMQLFPTSAVAYGDVLLRTNQFVFSGCVPVPLLASGFRGAGSLKRRVSMILNEEFGRPMSRNVRWALTILAICILPVTARGILAEDESPKATPAVAETGEAADTDAKIQELLQTMGTQEAKPIQALNELIQLGDNVVEPTRAVMNDVEQPFSRRWQAAKALGHLKAKIAVPDLLSIIEGDDNALVTCVAAESLSKMGDPALIPRLKKVLDNASDPLIKKSLENAIAVLEGREPIRTLSAPASLDFESGTRDNGFPKHWGGGGEGYKLAVDTENFHQGAVSGRIERVGDGGRFGSLANGMSAVPYRGKRIKYTGFLRSRDADIAGLWMRVDGVKDGVHTPLAFDNMSDRALSGTTDWKEYAIVLDVPGDASGIAFGFLLQGDGILWGDDLKIEAIDDIDSAPRTTGLDQETMERTRDALEAGRTMNLRNLDFEEGTGAGGVPKWWGGGSDSYVRSIDADKFRQGAASGRIERVGEDAKAGSLARSIPADEFLSKRIKYSGFLSTENAEYAALWMRVDTISDGQVEPIAFDNTAKQPLTGTTDWTERSIVLDVPEDANRITFGIIISGAGIVWGDDLKIEVVGDLGEGPETTGIGREQLQLINAANRERRASN